MPWSRKTVKAAHAVKAGAKIKGFSKSFAAQVIAESTKGKPKKKGKQS